MPSRSRPFVPARGRHGLCRLPALALAVLLLALLMPRFAAATPGKPLVYGVLADFPPYQVWPAGGIADGVDVALMRTVANRLNRPLQLVRYDNFRKLEADLLTGDVDVVSSMARTPARTEEMAFSNHYTSVLAALVTRDTEPSGSFAPDLAGRSIAVVSGYASEDQIERLFPIASRVIVPTVADALSAVRTGRADTFVELLPVIAGVLEREQLQGLRITRTFETPTSRLHMATRANNRVLVDQINDALSRLAPEVVPSLEELWSHTPRLTTGSGSQITAPERQQAKAAFPQPVIGVVEPNRLPFIGQDPTSSQPLPAGLVVDATLATLRHLGLGPPSWRIVSREDAWKGLGNGQLDLVIGLAEESRVASPARFLGPVVEYPMVLIGRPTSAAFDLDQLRGRQLALPRDHPARSLLESRMSDIEIVDCDNLTQCLDMVSAQRAAATLDDVVTSTQAMASGRWSDLQVIGTETRVRRSYSIAIAARHLSAVPGLRKSLDLMIADDLPALKTQWLDPPTPMSQVLRLGKRYGPWLLLAVLLTAWAWYAHARSLRAEVLRTRQAQAQAEAARAAGQRFTSFMAHEVRNSLHSVIAGTQLLKGSKTAEHALTTSLGESARNTLLLLNNLLERDRLDAGRLSLRLQPARLMETLQSVVDELQPAVRARGLTLVMVRTPTPSTDASASPADPLLALDPIRVQQIVRNLAVNAIKYSSRGDIVVRVASYPVQAGQQAVQVAVEDQGRGISLEDQRHVFEAFYRVENHHEVPASGTGLGLALCRDLAHLMGGDLSLRSELGVGTTVTLRWQCERPGAPEGLDAMSGLRGAGPPGLPLAGSINAGPGPLAAGSRPRLLLVEDAPSYGLVLEAALTRNGFDVTMAQTANEAALLICSKTFDVMVSDLNLPDGDAAQVFRSVQAAGGQLPSRLLLITAEIDDVNPALLAEWGAEAALPKTADAALLARQLALRCGMPDQVVTV